MSRLTQEELEILEFKINLRLANGSYSHNKLENKQYLKYWNIELFSSSGFWYLQFFSETHFEKLKNNSKFAKEKLKNKV